MTIDNARVALKMLPLMGTRAGAVEFTKGLEDDLQGIDVAVDAKSVISTAQGFLDELNVQVLENRLADHLVIENASPRMATLIRESAERRGLGDRLTVHVRAEF